MSGETETTIPCITADEAVTLAARGALADTYGALINLDQQIDAALLGAEPVVAIGADVLAATGAEREQIASTVRASPIASAALCALLRTPTSASTGSRFALESATYSMLQAGPEFAAWRAARPRRDVPRTGEPAVLVDRVGDVLHVRLNRPERGNAVDNSLRDALTEALTIALVDSTITSVQLTGNGNHFCTGGDLDAFDTFASPAAAHIVRLQRSPARMLCVLTSRLQAHLHGNCSGSGVELAAFAHRVSAPPAATFQLPELALGLVPGAGGTISIVNRIGAQKTAWLLLTQRRIDAPTALRWGLIDSIA